MWKNWTKPLLTQRIDFVIKSIENVFDEFDYIQQLDPALMATKYIITQKVPYKHQICRVKMEIMNDKEREDFDKTILDFKNIGRRKKLKKIEDKIISDKVREYPQTNAMHCSRKYWYFHRDFVMVNESKAEYCHGLYEQMLRFDNSRYWEYLGKVKAGLTQLSHIRGNLYCFLCDAHSQKHFNVTNKKIVFS